MLDTCRCLLEYLAKALYQACHLKVELDLPRCLFGRAGAGTLSGVPKWVYIIRSRFLPAMISTVMYAPFESKERNFAATIRRLMFLPKNKNQSIQLDQERNLIVLDPKF